MFRGCDKLTDASIVAVADGCSGLKELELTCVSGEREGLDARDAPRGPRARSHARAADWLFRYCGKESTEAKRNTHEAQPSGYSSEPRWIPADLAAELEEYRGNSEADGPKNGAQRRH